MNYKKLAEDLKKYIPLDETGRNIDPPQVGDLTEKECFFLWNLFHKLKVRKIDKMEYLLTIYEVASYSAINAESCDKLIMMALKARAFK